jgi:hypothetical protein
MVVVVAAAPIRVAAPEWRTVNMPPDLAAFYADELARALRAEGIEVVSARDIATLIGVERQKELLGCSDGAEACMAELGAALGCERLLIGQLARLDDTWRGTVRIVSATNGRMLAEEAVEASGQKALLSALERAARNLAAKLKPPPPPLRLAGVAWVPFAVGGALAAGSVISFGVAGSNADRIARSDEATAVQLASTGKGLEIGGWVLAGVGAAAVATGVIFLVTGKEAPPVAPTVTITPGAASVGLRGEFP